MISPNRYILLFIVFLGGISYSANAQLVYIPDSAFRVFLHQNYAACMVGDSIDSSCPAVLNTGALFIINLGIKDLKGIEVFVNVTDINCEKNQLTNIDTSISSLNYLIGLNCGKNQITSLPSFKPPFSILKCDENQLSTLPPLPASLTSLTCNDNLLSNLPALPNGISILSCNSNNLTVLPYLPASLQWLSCSNNQLNLIFSLPANLYYLNCSYNQISSLPNLPQTLTGLECSQNNLSSLPSLPNNLSNLNCSQNQINNLPMLPDSLKILFCQHNSITQLPTLPLPLTNIWCGNNLLTSLPTLTSLIQELSCPDNSLTGLPALPNSLVKLICDGNQITSLPSLPASLKQLYCHNNPLTCLPELKNVTNIIFYNTLINCLPDYGMVQQSNPSISGYPLCDVFNSNGCEIFWNIEGTTFLDANTNCNIESTEKKIRNQKINLFKDTVFDQSTYSNINGDYDFNTNSFGQYRTKFDTSGSIFNLVCPTSASYIDSITITDSLKHNRNFGLLCNGIDLAVKSISTYSLNPGTLREVIINAGDLSNFWGADCASGVGGLIVISINGPGNYFSPANGALTPTQVLGNVLTYNITDFGLIDFFNSFNFNLLVDTTATAGSQICIQVSISTSSPELDYNNNLLSFCATVVASYDPNDKSVYPSSTLDISGDRWLTYTIRFQNTGTAPAEYIYITDTLSAALDWSTFSLLSYSHQPLTQVYNDGLVKFSFPHINLPDSNSNEPASHGYVQFKIRVNSGLPVGSTIENTANIFFDFNTPVITNTTGNTVINCSIPPTIINASICGGDNYLLNNVQYYNSGVYTQRITTSVGCDSLIELHLSATTFNNSISVNSGTLQTSQTGTGYQWINCSTNTAISGATGQTYTPTQSGNYAVVVTDGICSDTSNCLFFSGTGIGELNAGVTLLSSINEETNSIRVSINGLSTGGNISITDVRGKIIFSEIIPADGNKNRQIFFSAATLARGMYMIHLTGENVRMTTKVVR